MCKNLILTISLILSIKLINAQSFKNENEARLFLSKHKIVDSIEGIWELIATMDVYQNDTFLKKFDKVEKPRTIIIFIESDTIYCTHPSGGKFGIKFKKSSEKNQYIYSEDHTDINVIAYLQQNILTTNYFAPKYITQIFLGDDTTKKLRRYLTLKKIFP